MDINEFIEGEDTFNKIIPLTKEQGEEYAIPSLLFESGYIPVGHKLYRCVTEYQKIPSEYIGRRIGFTRLGDTHKMFVEAKVYSAFLSRRLFYMWSGFYMDCPKLENYTYFGVIIGATTRMVLTEKCIIKKPRYINTEDFIMF